MSIELRVNGFFGLTIFHTNGEQVTNETEQSVLDNLQQGEYLVSLNSKTIVDINDYGTILYTFEIDPLSQMEEYEFEELTE